MIRRLPLFLALSCTGFGIPTHATAQVLDVNTATTLSSGTYSQINVDPGTPELTAVVLAFGGTTTTTNMTTASNSVTQLTGGTVSNAISAFDTSSINVSGTASIYDINALDNSQVTMTAGTITNYINGYDNAVINVTGGQMAAVITRNNSVAYVDGASLNGGATVLDDSVFYMRSGFLGNINYLNQRGVFNVSGGTQSQPTFAFDASVLNMSGGVLGAANLENSAHLNFRGGTITNNIMRVFQTGVVNIFGSGLAITSSAVGTEPLYGAYTDFILQGTLLDGNSITGMVLRDYDGGNQILNLSNPNAGSSTLNFNPVPVVVSEPTTIALLVAGMTSLSTLATRRRFGRKK